MHRGMRRLSALSAALILGGCENPPLAPDRDQASLGASGTGLTAPSNLSAVAVSPSRIDVAWQDKSSNETGFEVHRSTAGASGTFARLAMTGPNVPRYSDNSLSLSKQYCYKVRGFRRVGSQTGYSAFSSTACATTPAPPGAPSNANATPASSSQVMITWKDNSTNEYGFRIERSPSATGPWVSVAFQGADLWFYVDGERVSEQQVCYRVIAYNAAGDSPSNIDCTTPPAGPTNLVATSLEDQSIDLSWGDNSAVEDGYQVQRAAGSQSEAFSTLASLPVNSTSYRDLEVSPNTSYQYRVWAKKDGGPSDLSNIASAGSCVPAGTEEICDNGTDDDCDGLIDRDPECATCGWDACPSGFICDPDGFCISHCSDGWQNGDEGDVDCGGSCSAKCQAGQRCYGNFDCASNFCVNSICQ
jgi:fibronectin type III domain protein